MSVHWPIIRRIFAAPTAIAVRDDRRSYRRAELLVAAMHLADHLEGACRTQTLGIMLPTSGAFPIAALAGWILGKTIVPLNYLLKPEELQFVVDDCGTDTVVTADALLEHIGDPPRAGTIVRMDSVSFEGVPSPRIPARPADSELAALVYTSGTSGRPKGVMLTHANFSANIRQFTERFAFSSRDVMFGVLPQFHSFGLTALTLAPLSVGFEVVYAARFVPHRVLERLRDTGATYFVGIPSMFNALLGLKNAEPADFTSLKYAVSGAEPLPSGVGARFLDRFGVRIHEGFGMTETAPVTHVNTAEAWRPGSVGKPLEGVRQRIVDLETGRDLGPGLDGELRLDGPNVMEGYYNRPDLTAEAFDERGWLRTGDIARIDAEGFLYITGRLKDMIIVGGENVFPREIEEAIDAHPSVHACGVIGEPDDMRGEVPVAFIETEPDAEFNEQDLLRFCRDRIAGYKVPKRVIRVEALPRSPTGKVLRRELREMLKTEPAAV